MERILTEDRGMVGVLTLNHPEKRNALSTLLLAEMQAAIEDFAEQQKRAIIIRAPKGSKVWSAGHDIEELAQPGRDPLGYNDPLEQTIRAIRAFPAPVIAMVEGTVWGGACEMVMACDMTVATPTSSFAITPAKIGVPYNPSGIINFLNSVGIATVKQMFFTAKPVSAPKAEELGLINKLAPPEEIEGVTFALAAEVCENSPLSIAVIKEQIRLLTEAYAISPSTFERIQGLRRIVYDSNDYKEGPKAFLEKRKPVFRGN